jgi:hypothetical protein
MLVFGWLLLLLQLLVVDVVGSFSCVSASFFWLDVLELVLSPWRVAG